MKKAKISLPPIPPSEKSMEDWIKKGGSVSSMESDNNIINEDVLKSFTIKIYESELSKIRDILSKAPKRDRSSIHDFIVSAVKQKIEESYN